MGMTAGPNFGDMDLGLGSSAETPSSIDMFQTAKPIVSTSNDSAKIDFIGNQAESTLDFGLSETNGNDLLASSMMPSSAIQPSSSPISTNPDISPTPTVSPSSTQDTTPISVADVSLPVAQAPDDNSSSSSGKIVNSSPMASTLSLPDEPPASPLSPVLEKAVANTSLESTVKPAMTQAGIQSLSKAANPATKSSVLPSVAPAVTPVVTPDVTPTMKSKVTPEVAPVVTSSAKPSVASAVKSAATPIVAPIASPVITSIPQPLQNPTQPIQQQTQSFKVPPPAPSKPPVISKTTTSVDAGTVSAAAKKQTIANELGLEFDDGGSGQGSSN